MFQLTYLFIGFAAIFLPAQFVCEATIAVQSQNCPKATWDVEYQILDKCISTELWTRNNWNERRESNISISRSYTNFWMKCAEAVANTVCLRDSMPSYIGDVKEDLVLLWNNIHTTVKEYEELKNDKVSKQCICNLDRSSLLQCLPIADSYNFAFKRSSLTYKSDFAECLWQSLLGCSDAQREFFKMVMSRMTAISVELTGEEKNLFQECLETVEKCRLDTCVEGIYDALNRIVDAMPVTRDFKSPNSNCLDDHFSKCSYPARMIVSKVLQQFSVVYNPKQKPVATVYVHPDDKKSILKCLKVTSKKFLDVCVDNSYEALESVASGKIGNELISQVFDISKTRMCLNDALVNCTSLQRYVIHQVLIDVFEFNTKIPIERHSTVASPSDFIFYKNITEVNPINSALVLPVDLQDRLKSCLNIVDKSTLDSCIPGLYGAFLNISEGLEPNFNEQKHVVDSRDCLKQATKKCSMTELHVLDHLYRKYINRGQSIFKNIRLDGMQAATLSINDQTASLNCIMNVNCTRLHCERSFCSTLVDLVKNPKTCDPSALDKIGIGCLNSVLQRCSIRSRLNIANIIYQCSSNFPNVSLTIRPQSAVIYGRITEYEKASIQNCVKYLDGIKTPCYHENIFFLLKSFARGEIPIVRDTTDMKMKICFRYMLANCSTHSKKLISNFLRISTGSEVELIDKIEKTTVASPLTGHEKQRLNKCKILLVKTDINKCFPGFIDFLDSVLNYKHDSTIRPLSTRPLAVEMDCWIDSMRMCPPHTVLLMMKIINRFTSQYIRLPFTAEKTRRLLGSEKSCIKKNQDIYNKCVGYESRIHVDIDELKANRSTCARDFFSTRCSVYERMLFDHLMKMSETDKKYPFREMLNIVHERDLDNVKEGYVVYTEFDRQIVAKCHKGLNKQLMEKCFPGLYEVIKDLENGLIPNYAYIHEERLPCYHIAFKFCGYRARVLIMDMLNTFLYSYPELPLVGSSEFKAGAPVKELQTCLNMVDPMKINKCQKNLFYELYDIVINRDTVMKKKDFETLKCIRHAIDHCSNGIATYIISRISPNITQSLDALKYFILPELSKRYYDDLEEKTQDNDYGNISPFPNKENPINNVMFIDLHRSSFDSPKKKDYYSERNEDN